MILDTNWTTLRAAAQGFRTFVYSSDIEFVLIKTGGKISFQRVVPIHTEAELAGIEWDVRTDQKYCVFKIDPMQKVIIMGSPIVRFFRCSHEEEKPCVYNESDIGKPLWKFKRDGLSWEAEDIYLQKDVIASEAFHPEHLAEVARRFKAWRTMQKGILLVYLMIPRRLSDGESLRLVESGWQFFDDVPWIL